MGANRRKKVIKGSLGLLDLYEKIRWGGVLLNFMESIRVGLWRSYILKRLKKDVLDKKN